jgi:hypothetical protein
MFGRDYAIFFHQLERVLIRQFEHQFRTIGKEIKANLAMMMSIINSQIR